MIEKIRQKRRYWRPCIREGSTFDRIGNRALGNDCNDQADSTISETQNGTRWANDIEDINCVISQNLGYTVFSTVGAFYLPLTFIIAVYLNVYRVARSRIHRRQFDRRRDGDRPGGHREASTMDPDIDTSSESPGVICQA